MSRKIAPPFLQPKEDRIHVDSWVLASTDEPVGDYLTNWDYNSVHRFSQRLTVDLDGIRNDCQLDDEASLRLVGICRCEHTLFRGYGSGVSLGLDGTEESVTLHVQVFGKDVSKDLSLESVLTLRSAVGAQSQFAPTRRGCILWKDSQAVRVEGGASRFPVELVSFKESGLPPNAGWYLDWAGREFTRPVLGSIRLLINSDRADISESISNAEEDRRFSTITSAIQYDVARQLVFTALRSEEFREGFDDFEEGTVGASIRDLIRIWWSPAGLEGLAMEAREAVEDLEAKIQDAIEVFGVN